MCISAKPHCRTKSSVSENASSVSPGNPTIRSVVTAGRSKYPFSSFTDCIYRLVSYFRFIRRRVSSHPDCMERWKWGHRFPSAAARRQNASVTVRGSRDPRRTRIPSAVRQTASTRSISPVPSRRSWPQEEISIPVRTISR